MVYRLSKQSEVREPHERSGRDSLPRVLASLDFRQDNLARVQEIGGELDVRVRKERLFDFVARGRETVACERPRGLERVPLNESQDAGEIQFPAAGYAVEADRRRDGALASPALGD